VNLFDVGYLVAGAVLAPVWARKKRAGWDERFGKIAGMVTRKPTRGGRARVVLHAVSVGEAAACRSLVPLLAEKADVIVSVTTDTGLARARGLYGDVCDVVRTPLDFSWAVRRFLDFTKPDVVGLVELEVWPNLVGGCRARGIPVGVVNGRLSGRSFTGYRRARAVIGPSFRRLDFAAVQDEAYAARFRAMGVAPERVTVTGSMKWDAVEVADGSARTEGALALARALGLDVSRPIVVAGSTAPGEEALLHAAVPGDVQLVCAPRKPEWFDQAAAAMPGCVRRSAGAGGERAGATRSVLDSIGELSTLYRAADVVVIGRSFGGLYGSDPMEPAGLGLPVLIGPEHADFAAGVGLLEAAGGIRVVGRDGLEGAVRGLLADPEARRAMGEKARACVRLQQGASARHADLLMGWAAGTRVELAGRGGRS
jgi:3-deoxy-D-manno-octulosonic-acid transferase